MTLHMSVRLAWHDNGWNGHICEKPCENGYCVGLHSYPGGDVISSTRDLDFEKQHHGEAGCKLDQAPACGFSYNAFGPDTVFAHAFPPDWMGNGAKAIDMVIPPYTACAWCYERMFSDDVKLSGNTNRVYDNDKRFDSAVQYFSQFEPGKSLIFYYAGYSNPFSEEEQNHYAVVGVSRIKSIGDFYYYDDVSDEINKNYARGIIWQKPITSSYPEEGLRIPYEKYMNDEEIINKLVFIPENSSNFKYGSREVTDDDAIELILHFIEIVDYLIEIKDDSDNWEFRREWLNNLLSELWKARGPYPGMPAVLGILGLHSVISDYISLTKIDEMKKYYNQVCEVMTNKGNKIGKTIFEDKELKKIRREFQLMDINVQNLLLEILPRFDIRIGQMRNILDENRTNVSITASLEEIAANPYIIFEQYIGHDVDDAIPFYKIDNGILTSPELGLDDINDLDAGSAERLRALCVDELNRIAAHSFGKADTILNNINRRLERMMEWMHHIYKIQNFEVDFNILKDAIHIREDDNMVKYLYLKDVYEDERDVERVLRHLAEDLPDIPLKKQISLEKFKKDLKNNNSELLEVAKERYEQIIESQAIICMQIFTKPLCILSGEAGTGKTTVIGSILKNIRRVHGPSTSVLVMAPTGKATERIKNQTGEASMTIHSFLAKSGWINANLTLKRFGGTKHSDINTIIIDECSMIDLNLFATLVKAINWNSVQRLILVGDPNQLPPIGRGRVFADTIDWLKAEHPNNIGTLTENIRQLVNTVQGKGTGILRLADIFIQEKQLENQELKTKKEEMFNNLDEEVDKDLSVYYWKDKDELNQILQREIIAYMEKETGQSCVDIGPAKLWSVALNDKDKVAQPERIQVISPYRGEFYGTDEINRFMQETFNGYWSKQYFIDNIGLFDKVIQFRNRPQSDPAFAYNLSTKRTEPQEIFNGEIGIVRIHGLDNKAFKERTYGGRRKLQHIDRFQVQFSGMTRSGFWYNYGKRLGKDSNGRWIKDQSPSDNLELAYAISVHKSQGSEFDTVFIVIPKRDSHLLSMELLYTAITRAQKKVIILIQDDVGTMVNLSRVEKSAVRRINSSIFNFHPLPEEFLYFSNWYKEGKKLSTLTNYLVRSKSEVIIANLLFEEGIPFEYETPLFAPDGSMYLPDFTVIFRGETYYWEHVGMLNKLDYNKHWKEKEAWYNKHFPGKLIITYENDNLTKDAKDIIDKYR